MFFEKYNRKENIESEDKDGLTPLLYAVKNNNLINTEFLIKKNANINKKCNKGKSALDYAILNKNIDMIQLLIENKIERKNYDNYLYVKYKFPFLEDYMIEDIRILVKYYNTYFEKIISI